MPELTIADALRLAINVLRDSAESHRMPSGIELDDATAAIHNEAADTLQGALPDLEE